jgi:hypothetical protein
MLVELKSPGWGDLNRIPFTAWSFVCGETNYMFFFSGYPGLFDTIQCLCPEYTAIGTFKIPFMEDLAA